MRRFDIQFRLGSIPVRVEPGFWLITLLLGSRIGTGAGLALWFACEFAAVLVHELGHALAARRFGARPEIVLYAMGGLTRYAPPKERPHGRLASMFISFAGPLAGFLFAALALLLAVAWIPQGGSLAERFSAVFRMLLDPHAPGIAQQALWMLLWINVGWGAVNLLPILPLDGGNILRALLGGAAPESGLVRALWISAFIGPAAALLMLKLGMLWAAMLFAYFSYTSIRQLLDVRRIAADRKNGLHARLEDAQNAIESGDFARAEEQASTTLRLGVAPVVRRTAAHLLAVSRLERGDARAALDALMVLPETDTDPFLLGACLLACGRADDSLPHLERAVASGAHPNAQALLDQARVVSQAWQSRQGPRDDSPAPPTG